MGLEVAGFVSELVTTNPVGAADDVSAGDDHLRLIKAALQATFPSADHAIRLERPRADVASAATTNIGAATTNYANITGTTTITAFDTVAAGIWRFVRFNAALTLTHNATALILPGAANIPTAAGDHALAISLGSGNWVVPFYQKADGSLFGTVPVASGGTGQTTEAEALGEMTQALTEDTAPDRMADYASVYDASADTGKKVLLAKLVGRAVVATGTFSSTATLDIDLTPYSAFRLVRVTFWNTVPSDDAVSITERFSDDGGATFEADAADYSWLETYAGGAGTFDIGDSSDDEIEIGAVGIGSTTYEQVPFLEVTVVNPQGTSFTEIYWHGKVYGSDGLSYHVQGSGTALVAGVSTDVRFQPSTGTFESGGYTVEVIL